MRKKDFVTTNKWNQLKIEKEKDMKLTYRLVIGAVGIITCLYYFNKSKRSVIK